MTVFAAVVLVASNIEVATAQQEAIEDIRVRAEHGDAEAQYNLGRMYANGEGVTRNAAEAVRWFRLAADQGNVNAQYRLGAMYEDGKGVPQNGVEAVGWYRLAADQGHGGAMFALGAIYKGGEGILRDEAEAVRWYRLAAEQGFDLALSNLGFLFFEQGDYVQAYLWFHLYSERLPADLPPASRTGFRDMVDGRLTPDEREEAQRLAREWDGAQSRD